MRCKTKQEEDSRPLISGYRRIAIRNNVSDARRNLGEINDRRG